MSTTSSRAAVDRVAAKRQEFDAEDFGAYVFAALGLLAYQAPEVVEFILDQLDRQMEAGL